MKRAAQVFLVILPAFAFAGSAEGKTIFEGRLFYIAATNCVKSAVGEQFASVYHIANVGTNDNRSMITMVTDVNGAAVQRFGGRFTNVFQRANAFETGPGAATYLVDVRLISSSPATGNITPDTPAVLMFGQITNPRNEGSSCIVTFRASYLRRLE